MTTAGTRGNQSKASEPKGEVVALMRRMGVKGHPFNPMPPDQHRWQARKGEAPKHRMWSWMVGHTVEQGHRCEYAVNLEGRELHLEHIAKDLGMTLQQARTVWNQGEEQGLWRSGTKQEGKRKLYLSGSVKPEPAPNSEEDETQKTLYGVFPAHILKQIKDWPAEKVRKLRDDIDTEDDLERETVASAVAAARQLFTQRKDKVYQGYGVKLNPQAHRKNGETDAEAEERRAKIEPLLPGLKNFVQSFWEPVQSSETDSYDHSVRVENARASLYGQSNSRSTPESSSSPDSVDPSGKGKTPSLDGGKPADNGHAGSGAGLLLAHYYAKKNGSEKPPARDDRPLLEKLHKTVLPFTAADDHALRSLLLLCFSIQPDCTLEEVCWAVEDKGAAARGKKHPVAYLTKSVTELFRTVGFAAWRVDRAAHSTPEQIAADANERIRRREVEMARELLEDPNVDPEDRRWAEEKLRVNGAHA